MNTLVMTTLPEPTTHYSKTCSKPLLEQIDVVAEFYAHKIQPQRIAYRTGIELELVQGLINGDKHNRLFKQRLAAHRKQRRDQRLQQSRRIRGIAQADLQDHIEKEYQQSLIDT